MNRLFQTLALAIALGGAGWLIYRAQTQAQPAAPAPASATSVQPPSVTSVASAAQSSSAEDDSPTVKPAVMGSSKLIVLPDDVVPKPPILDGKKDTPAVDVRPAPNAPPNVYFGGSKAAISGTRGALIAPKSNAPKSNAPKSNAPKSNAPKSAAPKSKAPFMGSSKFAPDLLPLPTRPQTSK